MMPVESINSAAAYLELIDKVAQAIYHNEGGFTDEDFVASFGKLRKLWKTDAPWDTNPNELCEHERDDYRIMARAAIKAFLDSGNCDFEIIRHIMDS